MICKATSLLCIFALFVIVFQNEASTATNVCASLLRMPSGPFCGRTNAIGHCDVKAFVSPVWANLSLCRCKNQQSIIIRILSYIHPVANFKLNTRTLNVLLIKRTINYMPDPPFAGSSWLSFQYGEFVNKSRMHIPGRSLHVLLDE